MLPPLVGGRESYKNCMSSRWFYQAPILLEEKKLKEYLFKKTDDPKKVTTLSQYDAVFKGSLQSVT